MASLKIVCPDASVTSVSDVADIPSYTLNKDVFVLKALLTDPLTDQSGVVYTWASADGTCANEGLLDDVSGALGPDSISWTNISGACSRFLIVKREHFVRRFYRVSAQNLKAYATVTVKSAKASLSLSGSSVLNCESPVTLCANVLACSELYERDPSDNSQFLLDESGNKVNLDGIDITYVLTKDGCDAKEYKTDCMLVEEAGKYTLSVIICYEDHCVVEQVDAAESVVVTGDYEDECCGPQPQEDVPPVTLCIKSSNNNDDTADLVLLAQYNGATGADNASVYLNGLLIQTDIAFVSGKWQFTAHFGGEYTVIISRDGFRARRSNAVTVYLDEAEQVNNVVLDIGGNEGTQLIADDCESDLISTVYCFTNTELCALADASQNNVSFEHANHSPYQFAANSGYVLYNANGSVVSSKTFSADPSGNADVTFSELFGLNQDDCDCECNDDLVSLFGDYYLFLYNSNGEVLVRNKLVLKHKLEKVVLSASSQKMECDKTNTLSASVTGGSDNLEYEWFRNGVSFRKTSTPSIELNYGNEAGMFHVKVHDKGFTQTEDEVIGNNLCADDKESNKVLLYKEFSVKVRNNANGSYTEVDVNQPINLTAEVSGTTGDCEIKFQWFMKDCQCNYINDASGCRMLLGTSQNLVIQNPSVQLQKMLAAGAIVAHASYTNYHPEVVDDCTYNNIQQVWAHDSIRTVQTVSIAIENKSGENNLFNIEEDVQIRLCPLVLTPGYSVNGGNGSAAATSIEWSYETADASGTVASASGAFGTVDASNCLVLDRCDKPAKFTLKMQWQPQAQGCIAKGEASYTIIKQTDLQLSINAENGLTYTRTAGDADCSGQDLDLSFEVLLNNPNLCLHSNVCLQFSYELKDASNSYNSGSSSVYAYAYDSCNSYSFDLPNNMKFLGCDHKATLTVTGTFRDCSNQCVIGTISDSVVLTQKLHVNIKATNACDLSDVELDVTNIPLDPSGLILEASACGELPGAEIQPIVYQWSKDGVPLTPESTFSKLSVAQKGTYKVVAKQLLDFNSSGQSLDTGVITGEATVTVTEPQQPIDAVAIRPTQRNVVAFGSNGALIDNASNLGVLRAHVAPEQDDLHFQWFNNEQPILGANGRSFNPSNKPGSYSVKVSNSLGSVSSRVFNITRKN